MSRNRNDSTIQFCEFHLKEILAELVGNDTRFEWWMSNSYGSVNPILTYLLKQPCFAVNPKIMDWVLPKHWFTSRIMKVKTRFILYNHIHPL